MLRKRKPSNRMPILRKPRILHSPSSCAKLNASTQILEGLCLEDFDAIEKGAEKLKSMSNEERWRVSNDAMYRQQSAEFRDAVENILTAAKEKKSLDSAALAWTKTTLNCIECHRWVRNTLLAEQTQP